MGETGFQPVATGMLPAPPLPLDNYDNRVNALALLLTGSS